MINFTTGNIFESNNHAIVNTVNTVGVMGKGIALKFKTLYPDNYNYYRSVCDARKLKPGSILPFENKGLFDSLWIINFATKNHWRNPSKLEWIVNGLKELNTFLIQHPEIKSISIPGLGTSNGGLSWDDVGPLYEQYLTIDIKIDVYYK